LMWARRPSEGAHMRTSRPAARRARARSITEGSPPISSGRRRAGRVTPSLLGHRDRGQAIEGHSEDDDQRGDGQDLGRAADVLGGQRRPEGRGGGGGDDARRRHPAGEGPFTPGQLGPEGGKEGHQRAGQNAADRVDERALPRQYPLEAGGRTAGRTPGAGRPVSPGTTKIAPSMSAAPPDMPSSGPESTAAGGGRESCSSTSKRSKPALENTSEASRRPSPAWPCGRPGTPDWAEIVTSGAGSSEAG
jgi:hypothetical protein